MPRHVVSLASVAILSLSLTALPGCGDGGKEKGSTPPYSAPPYSGPARAGDGAPPADAAKGHEGVVEPMGPSIHMQGSHKLVDGGKTVVLLQSSKVDLKAYEGKRVRVKGAAQPTVEGDATIVDVTEVEVLP